MYVCQRSGAAGLPTSKKGHHMHTSLRLAPALLALCAALSAGAVHAQSAAQPASQGYQAILASPLRTPADRKTDERRKPAEFLAFAQVKPGMKAFDIAS